MGKPANQGKPAKGAPTSKPGTSKAPRNTGSVPPPSTAQKNRGFHSPGTRGTGKGAK